MSVSHYTPVILYEFAGIYAFPSKDKKMRDLVLNHFQKNEKTLIPNLFGFDYAENSDEVLSLVRKRYFGDKPMNESFYGFSKVS